MSGGKTNVLIDANASVTANTKGGSSLHDGAMKRPGNDDSSSGNEVGKG